MKSESLGIDPEKNLTDNGLEPYIKELDKQLSDIRRKIIKSLERNIEKDWFAGYNPKNYIWQSIKDFAK